MTVDSYIARSRVIEGVDDCRPVVPRGGGEAALQNVAAMATALGFSQHGGVGLVAAGRAQRLMKRGLDVGLASTCLLLVSPLLLVIALLVKGTSPGPVFFRQLRVGRSLTWAREGAGLPRAFEILKFRTMREETHPYAETPSKHADPRITRVGRFLRKTSLDELPQLVNVLRGDMALVGPRPEMPFVVKTYGQVHRRRLTVTPGITGLWQLYGSRSRPIHHEIEYDLFLLDHWSLWLDLRILWRTFQFVLAGGNV